MAIVYSNITLGLTKQNSTLTIEMPQGDTGRGLDVFISDDVIVDETAKTDNTLTAILWAIKPSGSLVSVAATSVARFENSDAYEIKFSDTKTFTSILSETGIVRVQITLSSNGSFVTSFVFNIKVVGNIAMEMSDNIASSDEYQNVLQVLSNASAYIEQLNYYVSQFQSQLKLTVNVRSGTEDPTVLSTDKAGDLYIKYEE